MKLVERTVRIKEFKIDFYKQDTSKNFPLERFGETYLKIDIRDGELIKIVFLITNGRSSWKSCS